jgi:phosphoribosyl 1,2-cyclic phosphate phosphodiesterase
MKVLYMGTAAEERIPGMFCNCELCQKSLKLGGKNIRTRAQALIDDTLLVDFGADTYDHFIKAGKTLWDIQHVLLTHSHPDHLTLEVFSSRNHWLSAETCKYPTLKVYTSAGVIEKIWRVVEARGLEKELIEKFWEFIPMNYYESFKIDDFTVTPLPANHARGEQAYIFLIEKDGKSMFYGNDTGTFSTDVDEWLAANNKYIDLLSLDCTKGDIDTPYYGHMSMSQGREIADRFLAKGVIDDKTKLYYTHFAHGCKMTHDELEKRAKEKYGFNITHDGFCIEV